MPSDKNSKSRTHRFVSFVAMLFLVPASFFYLFVVPMMVALSPEKSGPFGIAFGAFMLAQLFLVVLLYSYEVAAAFYQLPHSWLTRGYFGGKDNLNDKDTTKKNSKSKAIFAVFLMPIAYFMFIYAFSVLYVLLSNLSTKHFGISEGLSVIDAFYFSSVTATTVGYGDVTPKSDAAKIVTIVQIFLSLTYAVVLFSAFSAHLRELREKRPK